MVAIVVVVVVVVEVGLVTLMVVVDGLLVELHKELVVVEVESKKKKEIKIYETHETLCTIKINLRSIKLAPRREISYTPCMM